MTKLRVQAQHLQPGDIVGSGEKIVKTFIPSILNKLARGKIGVELCKRYDQSSLIGPTRVTYWGKYTEIGVTRND